MWVRGKILVWVGRDIIPWTIALILTLELFSENWGGWAAAFLIVLFLILAKIQDAIVFSIKTYQAGNKEIEQSILNKAKEIEQQKLRQAVAGHIIASEQKKETVEQRDLRRALENHTFASEKKKETSLSDTQPTAINENKETPESEDIYCTNCGKKARVNDKFCKGCGTDLTE